MDPMQEIMQMFFVECEEHLEALQEGLDVLKGSPDDVETVNTVFRAVHSIKGGAAAFGLGELVEFAHAYESALDDVRSGRLATTECVVRTLLRSADLLSDLVSASRDGSTVDPGRVQAQIENLAGICATGDARPADAAPGPAEAAAPAPTHKVSGDAPTFSGARIRFHPYASLFERGNEPGLILRELAEIGRLVVRCDLSQVPALDELNPSASYLSWEIDVEGRVSEHEIRDVFDFVEGDCDLTIDMIEDGSNDVGAENGEAPQKPAGAPEPGPKAPPAASRSAGPASSDAGAARNANPTVRVDLDRVDRLINLVGELVINQAMLSQSVVESGLAASSAIAVGLDEFKHLTREVQESVLAIRAQPVKSLFQRMSRIAREAADATGKTVRLVVEGESTEVDKTVIERLADPLTHMIRNAVDHGLERPENRQASGKLSEGTIWLRAEHRSGRVLIEIRDDGAGINRERVRQIAVERGLIPADSVLTSAEIDNLLFLPGFSTAEAISDLSGRGVGMDVVKRSIASLGGRISIASQPGEGTSFSISLPLTLAILDGMIVSVGGETVVVPLSAILEMLKPEPTQVQPLGPDGIVVQVRGEFVPVIDVACQLGFGEDFGDYSHRVMLLIETSDRERRALVVDAIQDQRQVVIKGLEENYGNVPGIAAATILGDGRIALILDTDAIVSGAASRAAAMKTSFALAG